MPRKQRFKPSRKPQPKAEEPAHDKVDERQEIHPDDVEANLDTSSESEVGSESSR